MVGIRGSSQPETWPSETSWFSLRLDVMEYKKPKTGKLVLARTCGVRCRNVVQHPVVQRTVGFKLECTQGMRDAFDGIGNAVRVVVHRVDAPFVAGVVVMGAADG